MATVVLRSDPRFPIASRTRNARFPAEDSQRVGRVLFCTDTEDVERSLQQVIDAGLRPTVRSSGHCYEDFIVNNPNGAILDVSSLNQVRTAPGGGKPYSIGTGTQLGRAYEDLFKLGNVTIPGGTCYTVTAGGHVSGGGYGTLARMYGLTVDWLTAVDIVTVDSKGKAVARHVDKASDPDLFRALRGGQGSNFGILTRFHFAELPPMPEETVHAGISWDWNDMSEDKFVKILMTYGAWMEANSPKKETWGLFSGLYITHKSTGRLSVRGELTTAHGKVTDLGPLYDLLNSFAPCRPASEKPNVEKPVVDTNIQNTRLLPQRTPPPPDNGLCYGERPVQRMSWLESTVGNQGGSGLNFEDRNRAKYKSCYMKKNFTEEEARIYYRLFTGDTTRGLLAAVDSYGGAVNSPERVHDTAIPQRSSVMKLQYQSYWKNASEDEYRLTGARETYREVYSNSAVPDKYKGTPWHSDQYEGCYINYPDADMLAYPFWPQLYYGNGDLYPFLQKVKRTYDPHNIFHHAMAVQA